MSDKSDPSQESTTGGVPFAPGLEPALRASHIGRRPALVDARVARLSGIAIATAILVYFLAQGFIGLINLVSNLFFHAQWSAAYMSPASHSLGAWVIAVPVLGALVIGFMSRYWAPGIRGDGIPEAMQQVLLNQSRIEPKIALLKPLSAAISIGTGGPFGAEGPIIASGGALGSLVGQILKITAVERKTLLAAGAAAGITAVFGSPVAAVVWAIELLLFEIRPRSIIPVALASVAAMSLRVARIGTEPVFPMAAIAEPSGKALALYLAIGGLVGFAAVGVSRLLFFFEEAFEEIPIHWMWWPAMGAVVVGVIGYFDPRTFGVGYENIEHILAGTFVGRAVLIFGLLKLLSWSIALGSGTSGGTLAPLFTVGGALGIVLGQMAAVFFPSLGIDPRLAALVGMAAMFSGASRTFLGTVIFAFEATRQPFGLLPLLGGCGIAYFASCLLLRNSIMTEKIARRGVRVPTEITADFLDRVAVTQIASTDVVAFDASDTIGELRAWLSSGEPDARHNGFPVVDASGLMVGVVTRGDLLVRALDDGAPVQNILKRKPVVVYDDCSVREAADQMILEKVGRLPVVSRKNPSKLKGIVSRSDILSAHQHRLDEAHTASRHLDLRIINFTRKKPA